MICTATIAHFGFVSLTQRQKDVGSTALMVSRTILSWMPDLRLPAGKRATLQEFISHARETTLRIVLHTDERAEVEVNDRVVAEAEGFPKAAALAELYTRNREILLSVQPSTGQPDAQAKRFYHVRSEGRAFEVYTTSDPLDLVYGTEALEPIASAPTLVAAVEKVLADTSDELEPAFYDQREIYDGLGQQGAPGIIVANWTSRWQTPFMQVLREDEFVPISLAVSRGSNGAYYIIYKLVSHEYLTELRSHHEAETIGKFASIGTARAYCDLFNAARHSKEWAHFHEPSAEGARSQDGAYFLEEDEGLYRLPRQSLTSAS